MNSSLQVFPDITVSASPDYSANDVVGGLLTISGMTGVGKTGVLKDIVVRDDAGQAKGLTFWFFNQRPTGTYTDNGAFAWGSGDFAKCCGFVSITSSDYKTIDSNSVAVKEVARVLQTRQPADSINPEAVPIYCIITADEAINFAATTDLAVGFGFMQD